MADEIKLWAPFNEQTARSLTTGDRVLLSGLVYVARDSAHKRILQGVDAGDDPPFKIEDSAIYYMGPTPAPPGKPIGSAGPTTAGRMDAYAPRLISMGLRAMIGKGNRSREVRDACAEHGAVYLGAIGGAGALISRSITKCEVLAYPEMGPEAVLTIEVMDMPLVVINDTRGGDLYEQALEKWAVK